MSFDLSNYTTVNERIIQFYDRYPTGVISTHPAKIVEIGSSIFISVIAEVYTAPDSPAIVAEAWEPYPGKTPYTRDSELMNCATSAIGRCMMQLAIGIDKAGASRDEVQARTPLDTITDKHEASKGKQLPMRGENATRALSEGQRKMVKAVVHKSIGSWEAPSQCQALTELLKREINTFDDLCMADVDIIKDAEGDKLRNAYFASMGMEIVKDDKPEDDPWAVEKW